MAAKRKPLIMPLQGSPARLWRRQLAASATYVDDTSIRTIKLPLELKDGGVDWAAVKALNEVVGTDQKGSLIGFLFRLHMAGFRLFGKVAEAEAFRNQAVLDDQQWREEVLSHSPLTVAAATFVPSAIYQRLLIAPRAVGGKDNSFNASVIAIEYAKFFCKGKHSDAIPAAEQALFGSIGEAMAGAFASWSDLTASQVLAAQQIDRVLRSLSYPQSNRSLSDRIAALGPCEPAGTLAFDETSAVFVNTAGIEPNLLVAGCLMRSRAMGLDKWSELSKACQIATTGDPNHSGLSWAFGKGLSYFKATSLDQVMVDFNVPVHRREAIAEVCAYAQAIPDVATTFLGGASYAPYRMGIGGLLTSWVANYCNRLQDLEAALAADIEPLSLPQALLDDDAMLRSMQIRPADLTNMLAALVNQRPYVTAALGRLCGHGETLASHSDIDALERYNRELNAIAGMLAMVLSQIQQSIEAAVARKDVAAQEHLEQYLFKVPAWIRPLERLNRLNLTPVAPQAELDQAVAEFELLRDVMHTHYQQINNWAQSVDETLSPMRRQEVREANARRNSNDKRNPREYALRACLDLVIGGSRRCSEASVRRVAEWFRAADVFVDEASLNLCLFNRRGRVYKSPFDTNPRQPYPITAHSVRQAEALLVDFGQFLGTWREEVMGKSAPELRELTDLFLVERAYFNVLMLGIPEAVPANLAVPESIKTVFNLPADIQLALAGEAVSSAVLRKIFNHYYVRLSALSALLFRSKWILRCKFSRAGENALLYCVPEGAQRWCPPSHYYQSQAPLGNAMRVLQDASDGMLEVDPGTALPLVVHQVGKQLTERAARAYLRQAPHEWRFSWPWAETASGVAVSKDGLGKRTQKAAAAQLIGPRHYMGVLDHMLADPDKVSVGDISIIVDQAFVQSVSRGPDGRLRASICQAEARVELALPISERKEAVGTAPFDRYVSIDLGERGLAYAVFDTTSHELVTKGRWSIKSMQALVRDDRDGRRKRSDAPKFKAAFDPAEERRRENVIGEYCHAINRLMHHYRAFPVLEYQAGGASSAIDKVYAGVAERYLFSQTPTVDAARKAYWAGASVWRHPQLLQRKFDKAAGKRSDTIEPLALFPGVGVSGYGSSQECACCRRNPVLLARDLLASLSRGQSVEVLEGGVVELAPGVRVRLYASAPESERLGYRQRNERTPLSTPLAPTWLKPDEFVRSIRRNLRQAPASRQTKDTSLSVYRCLFVDCGKVGHADENAAMVLGYRFQEEKLASST